MSEEIEKFGNFAKGRKEFYRKIGAKSLDEAMHEKNNVLTDLESGQRRIEEYLVAVEKLRSEINNKKSKIITRVLEFRKIRDLEKDLGIQEKILKYQEEKLAEKNELINAYDYLIAEEEKLASLMVEASKENADWDNKKKLELQEEEEGRNVSKLASKHGVFFIHDIVDASWKPSANNRAIDTQKLDFNDQLDILHGLEPTISVSTLHEGSKQRTFGKGSWGVLLSGGRVLGGAPGDAGTVAVGLKDRRFHSKESATVRSIDNAILRKSNWSNEEVSVREDTSYNELVVENPEIAGVYVKWDNEMPKLTEKSEIFLKNGNGKGYDRWWEALPNVLERGMPLFVLNRENNTVRLMYDINPKERSFKVTPEYDPSNITDMPGVYKQHRGKEEKCKAVMRVFDKAVGLIPENEKDKYIPDGTEKGSSNLYNIH
jgi:hypothetical protein